ncbi:hypothetical protein JMN32_08870, partial [Fulvivirga sp. 29W222]|nr:hypothetical protein [Fulvivirga marina]
AQIIDVKNGYIDNVSFLSGSNKDEALSLSSAVSNPASMDIYKDRIITYTDLDVDGKTTINDTLSAQIIDVKDGFINNVFTLSGSNTLSLSSDVSNPASMDIYKDSIITYTDLHVNGKLKSEEIFFKDDNNNYVDIETFIDNDILQNAIWRRDVINNNNIYYQDGDVKIGSIEAPKNLNIYGGLNVSDGNVGIGTTNPLAKLDVKGLIISNSLTTGAVIAGATKVAALNVTGFADVEGIFNAFGDANVEGVFTVGTVATPSEINVYGSATVEGLTNFFGDTKVEGGFDVYGGIGIHKVLGAGGGITTAGNISSDENISAKEKITVGETSTSGGNTERLLVHGRANIVGDLVAKRIAIYNDPSSFSNWPDYVFEVEYKLPSLATVEEYIKKEKHLPEVPSASEIAEEGLDLGKMDATLLKKVEELTLYTIDQEKKIKEQQERLKAQEERLQKLEALLIKENR